ncbi:MAG TPA: hypothetical protein VFY29_09750, partial [Terriglobia bacterium]|nr:hypothetical protein [Terriglobia bacterium]
MNRPSRGTRTLLRLFIIAAGVVSLGAQATEPLLNTMYQCPAGMTFQVTSCTGPGEADTCEMASFSGGRPLQRSVSTRADLRILMGLCHVQSSLESPSQGAVRSAAGSGTDANGFRVGDSVLVTAGETWVIAQIIDMNGNDYRVRARDGSEAIKLYPSGLRRIGPLTARDRAVGLFDLHERVQVLRDGKVESGEIVDIRDMDYQVRLAGDRNVWVSGGMLLPAAPEGPTQPSPSAPPAAAPAGIQAPRPGLVSCSGKLEGQYGT